MLARTRVEPAVVMALELDDHVPLGRGPREAERGLDHLGPGAPEPDSFGARHGRDDAFGEFHLGHRLACEQLAEIGLCRTAATTVAGA